MVRGPDGPGRVFPVCESQVGSDAFDTQSQSYNAFIAHASSRQKGQRAHISDRKIPPGEKSSVQPVQGSETLERVVNALSRRKKSSFERKSRRIPPQGSPRAQNYMKIFTWKYDPQSGWRRGDTIRVKTPEKNTKKCPNSPLLDPAQSPDASKIPQDPTRGGGPAGPDSWRTVSPKKGGHTCPISPQTKDKKAPSFSWAPTATWRGGA